jgi:hypothetical protein
MVGKSVGKTVGKTETLRSRLAVHNINGSRLAVHNINGSRLAVHNINGSRLAVHNINVWALARCMVAATYMLRRRRSARERCMNWALVCGAGRERGRKTS